MKMRLFSLTRALVARKRKIFALFFALAASVGISWALEPLSGDTWNDATKTLTVNSNTGNSAYASQTAIKHLIVSDAVTELGWGTFFFDSLMTTVELGNNLETIGISAFNECRSLSTITVPASVTYIGVRAFRNCTSLTTFTCEAATPPTIGNAIFENDNNLTAIYVPAASVDAYKSAWSDYASLISAPPANSITINGTPQVGDNSISLTYYFDPDNVPGLDSYAPTLKVKCVTDNKWDEIWLSLSEISSGTTTITLETLGSFQAGKEYAVCYAYFNGSWVDEVFQSFSFPAAPTPTVWTSLSVGDVIKVGDQLSPSVEWESANDYGVIKPAWAPYTLLRANIVQEHEYDDPIVTEAEDGAYYVFKFTHPTSGTCYLLANSAKSPLLAATATSDGLEVTNVGDDYGTPAFTFAVHDGGGSSAPAWVKAGDVWDEDTKTLTVNSNPGSEAYYQNTQIEHLIISDGVTTIGESAFDECTALLSVVIGNDVTNIEAYAFDECRAMTSLTIGNKVQTIGESAFGSCESLTSVIIPNSVTSIGESAFDTCDKISSLTIGNSVQSIGEDAFTNCSALTDVTIPASVENIGAWFFRNCENLATITCEATTPPTLGNNAFFDCDKLEHIYVPAASVATYKAADNWATKEAIISAAPVEPIPCTAADLGKVLCTDGSIYATVSEATAASKTAVAMIAYVDTENGKALALALADESGDMQWETAKTTAPAHTPAVSGGTWTLASKDDWSNMITAAGGYEALRDGFSSVGGTNMNEDKYWSSTPENTNAWCYYFNYGMWVDGYVDNPCYVRACLAFDIPAAPAYETVMNLINAIGTVELTAECKAKIDAARAAYDAMSDGDKAQVTNIATLTTAEEAFENVMNIWLSGDCDVILWKDTTLTVRKHAGEGNGAMADYNYMSRAPWYSAHWYDPKPNDIVIKSVTIEEGVTHLGDYAFAWMSEMKTVTIPSSVTTIPEDAFYWSKAVDDIYLTVADPSNLTWALPHSADVQFKPSKATLCHVPADLLTAYQEKFGTLNMTFVGDLDPITPLTPEQQQALDAAKDKIAALPSPVVYTPACKDAIDAARAAYDALTPDMLKQLVSNYATLTAAEATYANLKDVVEVEAKINEIPSPMTAENTKLSVYQKVQDARAAYDALTADQQALVSNYDKLEAAEAAFAAIGGGTKPVDIVWNKNTGIANVSPGSTSPAYEGMTVTTGSGSSFSQNSEGRMNFMFYSQNGGFTFANENGYNITKVVIESTTALTSTMTEVDRMGSGWAISNENKTATWTGDAATVKIWEGRTFTNYWYVDSIVFTVNGPASPLADAQAAKDLIDAIGEVSYPDSKEAIKAAREAVDALGANASLLDDADLQKLTDAEAAYAELLAQAVKAVKDQIDALPATPLTDATKKLSEYNKVTDARAAYDALSDEEKAAVTNYDKLTAAEEAFAAIGGGGSSSTGALPGKFTINEGGDQISFAKGNLQATTEDLGANWTWGFAANQWNYLGIAVANSKINGNGTVSENGTVDLFGWSTAATYYGINNSYKAVDYIGDFVDWGPNMGAGWRTLTKDEWAYLLQHSSNGKATVNDKNGYIFLPDNWSGPAFTANPDNFTTNVYSGDDWTAMENAGAVFLPSGPARNGTYALIANDAKYCSSTSLNNDTSYVFTIYYNQSQSACTGTNRAYGCMVRLVSEGGASPLADAQAAKDLIDAIPQPVVLSDECNAAIKDAREAVTALGENASLLDDADIAKLAKAEADFALLIKDAQAVMDLIDAIGEVTFSAESKEKIVDARNAYEELADELKPYVTNLATLTAAEDAYEAARPYATITTMPEAIENLYYNGLPQTLITAGAAEHGTMLYSLNGTDYSAQLPAAVLASAYTVYYKVQATDDYKDVAPATLTAAINYNYPTTFSLFGIPEGWRVKVNGTEATVVNGAIKNIAEDDKFDVLPTKPEDVKLVEVVPYILDLSNVTDSVIYVMNGDSITGTATGNITLIILPDAKVYFKDVNLTNTGEHPAVLCGGNAEIVLAGKNTISCTTEGMFGIRAAGVGTTLTLSGNKAQLTATIDPNGGTVNQ